MIATPPTSQRISKLKTHTAILCLLMVAVFWAGCDTGNKTVTLKFKHEPGMKLAYQQTTKQNLIYTQGDSTIKEKSGSYQVAVLYEILSLNEDGSARVKEAMTWSHEEPNEQDPTIIDTIERHRELISNVAPNGEIVDELQFKTDESPTTKSYINDYVEQAMPVFPSEELAAGQSWTQNTLVAMPNETLEASTTYKLASFAREAGYDCVLIEYAGNLIIPFGPAPDDSTRRSGIDRISTEGVMYFAYREGLVVLQREKYILDGARQSLDSIGEMVSSNVQAVTDVVFVLSKLSLE
jgi:hypothetical protein